MSYLLILQVIIDLLQYFFSCDVSGDITISKDGFADVLDDNLKELCEDLFCHIFDAEQETGQDHNHIFHCDAPESPFLHLFIIFERRGLSQS